MCHMARTADKVHIKVFHQYPTFNLVFFLPIFTEALSTEKATYLSHGIWFCVITLSLYISFTLMSITKFPRTNNTNSAFESFKPSLDFYYVIWNKALYYIQQLRWAFSAAFCRTVCMVHPQLNIRAPFNLLLLIWFFDTIMCKVSRCDRNTFKTNL